MSPEHVALVLRPYRESDLPIRSVGESEYDDFGPARPLTTVPPYAVWDAGHLAVDVDGIVVGDLSWHWEHYGPGTASRCPNIGISLAPEHRGHGYGTQAQRLLVDLLFRSLPVNRVEAGTDVTNLAEQRSLEKAGFTREGVARGSQWRRGAFHDLVIYSVLREEWASLAVRE